MYSIEISSDEGTILAGSPFGNLEYDSFETARSAAQALFHRTPRAGYAFVYNERGSSYQVAGLDMADVLTTEQAAASLGVTERRVRALAISRRVGQRVGRDWLFTPADLEAMRVRTPGRPRSA